MDEKFQYPQSSGEVPNAKPWELDGQLPAEAAPKKKSREGGPLPETALEKAATVEVGGALQMVEKLESPEKKAAALVRSLRPALEAIVLVQKNTQNWAEYTQAINKVRETLQLPPLDKAWQDHVWQITDAMKKHDVVLLEDALTRELVARENHGGESLEELWNRRATIPGVNFAVGAMELNTQYMAAIGGAFAVLALFFYGSKKEQEQAALFFAAFKRALGDPKKLGKGYVRWDEFAEAFDSKHQGTKAGYVMGEAFMEQCLSIFGMVKLVSAIKEGFRVAALTGSARAAFITGKELVEEVVEEGTFQVAGKGKVN